MSTDARALRRMEEQARALGPNPADQAQVEMAPLMELHGAMLSVHRGGEGEDAFVEVRMSTPIARMAVRLRDPAGVDELVKLLRGSAPPARPLERVDVEVAKGLGL